MNEDRIINIESRCEAPETDICYEGAHLSAEYDADYDCTEISGQTYQCKDALKGLDGARWTGSAWVVDGNKVANVRNADAHWAGGRTTLARRIASALRNVPSNDCYFISLGKEGCTVAEVTEAATCAAIALDGEAKAEEPTARRIAISLRAVGVVAAKGAAHAVRSARARKAWETRRRNAAAKAEIINATCEPMAADVVSTAECCDGTPAHGAEGRVVTAYVGGPIAEWSDVRHDYLHMAHTDGQYCETRGRRSTSATVRPVWAPGTYWPASCVTMDEARRARRRARDAAWHREHRRLARERKAA